MDFAKLTLGIDIGTSSVKVSLLDGRALETVYAKSVQTKARITDPSHAKGDEQDVIAIFESMRECLNSVPGHFIKEVPLYTIIIIIVSII